MGAERLTLHRIFLLSPANCGGTRAKAITSPGAASSQTHAARPVIGHNARMRTRISLLLVGLLVVPAVAAWAQKAGKLSQMDYIEIQQLYAHYNMAVDGNDAKLLETVFTPDGEFISGTAHRKGRELVAATATKRERPQVTHMATSITITPTPEGAHGTSYLMLVNLQTTPPVIRGGGYYEDVIVKTPDGWRFKSRTYYSQAMPPAPAPPQNSSR